MACLLTVGVSVCGAEAEVLELTGRVVDTAGAPIASAKVELQPIPPFYDRALQIFEGKTAWETETTVRTTASGEYRLAVPEPGMWQVEVSANGRVPLRCRLAPQLESETLPDAVLEADAGLDVRVEDGDGSPLAGAQVWAALIVDEEPRSRRGAPRFVSPWRATGNYGRTGERGRVRLARKASQKYRLHSFATGFLPAVSTELSTASTTLRLEPGKPVTVLLRSAAGDPVPDAVVTVSPLNWVAAVVGEGGRARVFVTPGEPLRLTARQKEGQIEATELSVPKSDFADGDEVTRSWALPPPITLAGRVIDRETREPVGAAMVFSPQDVGEIERSDADGSYRVVRGSGERWVLEAAAPGYAPAVAQVSTGPDGPRGATLALRPTGALAGRVVDPVGEPIEDALVRVTAERQALMARTTEEGAFRMGGLVAGRSYELVADAQGFAPEYRRLKARPGHDVEIVLQPGRSVTGRLVTPDFEPVVGGRVYMVAIESDPRMRSYSLRTERLPRAGTDGEGRFRLDGLPPRLMALVARHEGLADRVVRGIELADHPAGDETVLDLGDVEMGWGVALEGRVVSDDKHPIEDARIVIYPQIFDPAVAGLQSEEDRRRNTTTDTKGGFRVEGLSKNQSLTASVSHPDYVDRWLPDVDPQDEAPVEIVLERGARIAGRVVDDSGQPVEGVRLDVMTIARETPSAGRMAGALGQRPGFSKVDGTFEILGIAPGRVELGVQPVRGWIAHEPLEMTLSAGEERTGVLVRVGRGAELAGRVTDTDGRPVEDAGVQVSVHGSGSSLVNRFHVRSPSSHGSTDGDGHYSVRGIDPKIPQVVVSVRHPDYASLERTFEIRRGRNHLDLVVEKGGVLSGVVLTEAGEPVGGAQIEMSTVATHAVVMGGNQVAESGGDGRFEISGLTAGAYRLRARKTGFAESALETVEAGPGQDAYVTLTLRTGGTIRGRILGVDPDDLGQVQVIATDRENGAATGTVDENAEYRILNVGFSEGQIMAMIQARGRVATESFALDPRGGETWVDLEFGEGSTLSGVVRRNGGALEDAQVVVHGSGRGLGTAKTDSNGRFRIEGLEDRMMQVTVSSHGDRRTQSVLMAGDTEIEIDLSSARLSGQVVTEDRREPVAGARVTAAADGDLSTVFSRLRTITSFAGEFELDVPAGKRVTVRARAAGLSEDSLTVDTASGDVTGLELVLGTGDELELSVTMWNGLRPGQVSLALLDGSGNRVAADSLMGRPAGSFRMASAPPGEWTLLLATEGAAVVSQGVTIPGPAAEVVLPQGASVSVAIPLDAAVAGARVRLLSPSGTPLVVPMLGEALSEIPLPNPYGAIPFVPPGDWIVELIDPSTGVRRQPVTAIAGEIARVSFE